MIDVEKENQDTCARLEGRLARLGNRVRLATRVLRAGAADDDVFELLDGLRRLVLEDLEILLTQVGDRRAVARGIDVDAHVVRGGTERRPGRLILSRKEGERDGGEHERSRRAPHGSHYAR